MVDADEFVDDTPENLALLSDALEDAGYLVLVALDGSSALNRIQRRRPDLILLDAMMPGLDGFETCRQIKSQPDSANIPVPFMTALTHSKHVVKGFEAGAIDYVTKPIECNEVLARVASHLRTARILQSARGMFSLMKNETKYTPKIWSGVAPKHRISHRIPIYRRKFFCRNQLVGDAGDAVHPKHRCAAEIANKLAPTGLDQSKFFATARPVGARLACEGFGAVSTIERRCFPEQVRSHGLRPETDRRPTQPPGRTTAFDPS
ncbi:MULTISPECIES: response regulator [unclassified Pseudomonas]|uniref:response regulator n=1 Tax=unclassified Pseudomonas TaxID=196821 RepID=UPI002AC8CC74|nr:MULTISPECIES: response regulator [unclassified Pseudomonas]MEB0040049.1 response regulator [Pseudomonas sp. MH10]MEB0119575.1 response regulator [Pseudomonas sp. CCI1.2]WPX65178.1 response regulator [Pseudomonas sp. MH10]